MSCVGFVVTRRVLDSVLVGKEGREGINLTILSGFRSTIRHLTCSTPSEIIEADQIDLAATIHLMDILKCVDYRPGGRYGCSGVAGF